MYRVGYMFLNMVVVAVVGKSPALGSVSVVVSIELGVMVGNGSAYAVAVVFVLAMMLIGYGTFSEVPLAILIGAVLGVGSIVTVLYVYTTFN
jgi:hypothetical protein